MLKRLWLIVSCLLLVVVLVGEPKLPTRTQRFGRYTRIGVPTSPHSFSIELELQLADVVW